MKKKEVRSKIQETIFTSHILHSPRILALVILSLFFITATTAIANFQVTAFACTPNEVPTTETFTCTATIQNTGDSTGSLSTATLYPDETGWLEKSNYQVSVGGTVSSGASTEVAFTGLKAKKTGNNGFARIILDSVTDTYVSDNHITVNTIDILTTTTSTASSAAAGGTVDITGRAIVGGNVDTTLTLNINSGGCNIGNQPASETTTGMTNNQQTSRTWTITMGTADCAYTFEGKAVSRPGALASKTDTTTGTITCSSGCSSSSSSDSSSSSSGGSASGSGGGSSGSSKNTTKTTTTETKTTETTTQEDITKVTAPTTEETKITAPQEIPQSKGIPRWIIPVIFIAIIGIAGYLYRKYKM